MSNLIFCFDGTCNEPNDCGDVFNNTSLSNILKIHLFCGGSLDNKKHHFSQQKSFYYSGVGTYGNWLSRVFNSLLAYTFSDIEDILAQAKTDFNEQYNEHTKVYIFGFSRGAAIARMFAAQLCQAGVKVHFLGVFDTVASIGLPRLDDKLPPASDVVFEHQSLSSNINHAIHCVAIDEQRLAFQPTLINKSEQVKEVWFAGVHSDIGGGFWHDGLSDITLAFMISQSTKIGLQILELNSIELPQTVADSAEQVTVDDLEITPIPCGHIHVIERSGVLARQTLSARNMFVSVNDLPSNNVVLIHQSVLERFKRCPDYRPLALRDTPCKVLYQDGSISNEVLGIHGLRQLARALA